MLWYKSWLDTRSRFLIGLALLMVVAAGNVYEYPQVAKLLPLARAVDASGPMGRLIRDAADVQREYRGFVWWQWFRQNLSQMGTLFAILLGSGGLFAHASGRAMLFTLSLPVSRTRLLEVRAATGLGELLLLMMAPSLLIPLLAPAIGEHYPIVDALVHGACVFVVGAVFFSLALLLSTMFADMWRPLMIACGMAVFLAVTEQVGAMPERYGLFRIMNAEAYFRSGVLPWGGLLASAVLSAGLLFGAALHLERRDF